MISIYPISQGCPFSEYPQLNTIWSPEMTALAQEAIDESFVAKNEFSYEIGEIYLIKDGSDVVGITGFFPYEYDANFLDSIHRVGLRYHGLIPEYRGKGYSPEIIRQLLVAIINKYPNAETLIELAPVNEYGDIQKKHFERLGFVTTGPSEKYDWAEHRWQPMHLNIHDFLATPFHKGSKSHSLGVGS